MDQALSKRKQGDRKHRDKQCLQLWMRPEAALTNREHKRMWKNQREFISQRGYNADRLELFTAPTITPASTGTSIHQRATPRLPVF